MRYPFICHHAGQWPVRRQCRLLGVSASGYYAWSGRPATLPAPTPLWQAAAQQLLDAHAGRYGTRRLRAALDQQAQTQAQPVAVGRDRLRLSLRETGQRARCTRPPVPRPRTTQPDPAARCAPNRLADAHRREPDLAGRYHLPAARFGRLGLPSRLARRPLARRDGLERGREDDHRPVLDALRRAVAVRQQAEGLLAHGHGCQYTSHAFTQYLTEQKFVASCSRTGNPYDNALVESGWSTLKPELLPQQAVFEDVQLAREEIEYYLGTYYNSLRLHSAIGYRTPTQFEQQFTPPTQLSVFTRPPQLTAGRRALVLVGDVA